MLGEKYTKIDLSNKDEMINSEAYLNDGKRNSIVFENEDLEQLILTDGARLEIQLVENDGSDYYFYLNKLGVKELIKYLSKLDLGE